MYWVGFLCRYTLLPFRPDGWTPAAHHKYPRAMRAAFKSVLLAAARGHSMQSELVSSCKN